MKIDIETGMHNKNFRIGHEEVDFTEDEFVEVFGDMFKYSELKKFISKKVSENNDESKPIVIFHFFENIRIRIEKIED